MTPFFGVRTRATEQVRHDHIKIALRPITYTPTPASSFRRVRFLFAPTAVVIGENSTFLTQLFLSVAFILQFPMCFEISISYSLVSLIHFYKALWIQRVSKHHLQNIYKFIRILSIIFRKPMNSQGLWSPFFGVRTRATEQKRHDHMFSYGFWT